LKVSQFVRRLELANEAHAALSYSRNNQTSKAQMTERASSNNDYRRAPARARKNVNTSEIYFQRPTQPSVESGDVDNIIAIMEQHSTGVVEAHTEQ
jgi:hypothetical protein